MEPQTRANQLLPQIATLIGIDLGARIIEELIFKKRAELRIPIVICAGNNLPREVRVTSSSARVKGAMRALELGTCGFGIVDTHSAPTYGWNLPNANLPMKFPINAPVLIQVVRLLDLSISQSASLKVKFAPPLNPL